MALVQDFLAAVERHPERVAVIDGRGRETRYDALAERAQGFARHFRDAGLGEGDRVLLAMPLGADLYAALAGLWWIGAVAVLPEPALGLPGLRHAATALAPRAWLSQGLLYWALGRLLPDLARLPLHLSARTADGPALPPLPADPDRPALVSFTSGSTGRPKAIARSHGFLAAQEAALAPLLASDRPDEIDCIAFPAFGLMNLRGGVTTMLPPWPIRRPDRLDAKAVAAILERRRVTRLLVPPSALERLLAAGIPPSITTIFTGGGPVWPDLVDRAAAAAPRARVVGVYGSTEAEPIAHVEPGEISPADRIAMASGAGILVGHPVPEVRVAIVADEIHVAGDHVVQGYVDPADDASTKTRDAQGTVWHRTGDAGRIDDEGRLWLLGRHKGRTGGHYPFEVEVPARTWPGVRAAALVETPHGPVLAIAGDRRHAASWVARARALGLRVAHVKAIPMDRRHRSKVDAAALAARLARVRPL